MTIVLAQGSYAKFKVKAEGEDLTAAVQVHAFVYNEKGQIVKQFARVPQSGYTTYVPDGTDAVLIEMLPDDTKNIKPGKYFVDLQKYIAVSAVNQPMHNPSYLDENVLFELKPSIASGKPAA